MTGTSSARPDRLQAYPGALDEMDDELDTLAGTLDDRLQAFKDGAGGYATGFDPDGPGSWVRGLAAESRHLAGWVRSVGSAFEDAGDSGSGIVSMDDSALSKLVGEPTILRAERAAEGQADAAELKTALEAAGIDPENFDVDQLRNLNPDDPAYMELFDLMERVAGEMWSEPYAVGFYDQMNPDGMQAIMGVIEMFAAHQQATSYHDDEYGTNRPTPAPDLGSIQERLLDPMVHGFAIASGSVDLQEEREALLNPDDDINGDGRWQQHQLAMWLSDEGRNYDPGFLAQGADVILNLQAETNWANLDNHDSNVYDQTYPPLAIGSQLWDDQELAFNELVAMRALADNSDASFEFLMLDGGDGRTDRLALLLQPNTYIITQHANGQGQWIDWDDAQALATTMEQYGADIVDNAVVGAIQDDPLRYDAGLDIYADMVRVGGDGDVPDVTKRVLANAFALYVDDIGELALLQQESSLTAEEAAARNFNRPDLVAFFQELGYDEEAAAQLGESISVWATQESLPLLENDPSIGDVQNSYREVALVLGAIEDGFTATGDDLASAHAGFVKGLQVGGTLVRVVGVAAIPVTGGASLLLTGASTLAGPLLDSGISTLAGDPDAPPLSGGQVETAITQDLRHTLAVLVAERDGLPIPQPGGYASLLSDSFVGGDPVEYLDAKATDEANDYGSDDHWNHPS